MTVVTRVIKSILPKTLMGRSLLIIVTPLIVLQVFSTWIFFDRHWETVAIRLARGVAGDIVATIDLMRENPTPEGRQAAFDFADTHFNINMQFREGAILKNTRPPANPDRIERVLRHALTDRMQRPMRIDPYSLDREVLIDIQMADGVLHVDAPLKRLFTSTTFLFIGLMVGSSLILFAVAMLFMRNQIRPVRRLAEAADAVGKGQEVPFIRLQGATEVRQVGQAFNLMRERLQRQLAQRTEMLAGVSHDLRTPLTRLRLQIAMLGDIDGAEELKSDVAEMERMIEGYLAFARGEGSEPRLPVDLCRLTEDAVGAARRAGADIEFAAEDGLILPLRKEAFRRCISNLIGNAARYGSRVAVGARRKGKMIEVTVDDDGPGIPAEQREVVFRPFHRLDASRNAETGGVGLGLSIARDVVHSHGGGMALEDSPLGGLRARLWLPV